MRMIPGIAYLHTHKQTYTHTHTCAGGYQGYKDGSSCTAENKH